MGYKTFEDMKHNIPEGATHYRNECESFLFTWFKETDSGIKFYEEVSQNWNLIGRHVNNLKSKMVKIPSQIETPEEKEALDMIGTTSKQIESLANDSESPNSSKYVRAVGGPIKLSPPEWIGEGLPPVGAECEAKSGSLKDWFKGVVVAHDGDFAILKMEDDYPFNAVYAGFESRRLRRIESESDKLNIERLEAAYDLWLTWCHGCDVDNSMSIDQFATLGSCPGYLAIVDKTGYRKEPK